MAPPGQVLRPFTTQLPRPGQLGSALSLWRHPRWDRDRLLRFQDDRLRRVVRHAADHIPFYRQLYRRHGVDIASFGGARDLAELPLTTKLELREAPTRDLLPPDRSPEDLVPGRTSGMTGIKLLLWREPFEVHLIHTFRMRAWRQIGVRFSDRIARVALAAGPTFALTRIRQAAGIFRQSHVSSSQTPESVLATLEALAPDVLTGYAGVLYAIARAARKKGATRLRPRIIISGAERLGPAMRHQIEETFSVRVVDFYVALEFNLIGWQCGETGLYHVCEDNVALEILDNERAVEEGKAGEVVLTGLHAFTTPLLRYRLGDVAERGPAPCPCGQPFATLRTIQGRTMEYFNRGDGTLIHHWELSQHITGESASLIARYQFVQKTTDRITMKLLPTRRLDDAAVAAIEARGQEKLGPAVRFEVQLVDHIPIAPSGKMIQSVNLVDSPNLGTTFDFAGWHAQRAAGKDDPE